MGNHQVGRAMAQSAEMALEMRASQPALELLDKICEPYRDTDAEFDDSTEPNEPLGKLMVEAFSPGVEFKFEDEEHENEWYEKVYRPFRERYDFW